MTWGPETMLERRKSDIPEIGKMVERRIRNGELARSPRHGVRASQRCEVADFIAISREVAAGSRRLPGFMPPAVDLYEAPYGGRAQLELARRHAKMAQGSPKVVTKA